MLAQPGRMRPEGRRVVEGTIRAVRIYTGKGDDGTTGLLYGGRVRKDSPPIELNGVVDEAQAALGSARVEFETGSEADQLLSRIEGDLYVLMAEVATAPENRGKLVPGTSLVTDEMVTALEGEIDDLSRRFDMPTDFVIPGQNRRSAALDVARTIVRRAERVVVSLSTGSSTVRRYLNRLSDLLWVLARWQEQDQHPLARDGTRSVGLD
jgi:cob(I)alamin adenosyltransferase